MTPSDIHIVYSMDGGDSIIRGKRGGKKLQERGTSGLVVLYSGKMLCNVTFPLAFFPFMFPYVSFALGLSLFTQCLASLKGLGHETDRKKVDKNGRQNYL
jgi:hypothetical protein